MSDGYCVVSLRDGGGEYRTSRDEHTRLLAEWQRGAAFLAFTTVDGGSVTAKGACIESIADMSADTVDRWLERNKAEKREREREL